MKINFKAGILIIILLVPAFVYLFLKFFGSNHYGLHKFVPVDVVEKQIDGKIVIDTLYHTIPAFSLTSNNGSSFGSTDLEGKIYVADFFFSRCPSICPKMTSQLTRVQSAFADVKDFSIVSFTVDPENDSPEVLQSYASKYKADSKIWFFLTGKKDSIYRVAKEGFKISAMEDPTGGEEFVHSDKLILVDKNKIIRGFYNGTEPKDVDRLITEIKVLMQENE